MITHKTISVKMVGVGGGLKFVVSVLYLYLYEWFLSSKLNLFSQTSETHGLKSTREKESAEVSQDPVFSRIQTVKMSTSAMRSDHGRLKRSGH